MITKHRRLLQAPNSRTLLQRSLLLGSSLPNLTRIPPKRSTMWTRNSNPKVKKMIHLNSRTSKILATSMPTWTNTPNKSPTCSRAPKKIDWEGQDTMSTQTLRTKTQTKRSNATRSGSRNENLWARCKRVAKLHKPQMEWIYSKIIRVQNRWVLDQEMDKTRSLKLMGKTKWWTNTIT